MPPTISLSRAELSFGDRTLWSGLDLDVEPGQFLTVLGPNGAGKSTLLKVLMGLTPLTDGTALVEGRPAAKGNPRIGYIPQQNATGGEVPIRGIDFVQLGLDGASWGLPRPRRHREKILALLAEVEGTHLAYAPLHRLSGGEQQRLRAAQALAGNPHLLLCDEPLLSLDLKHQRRIVDVLDKRRREHGTSVLFVTHEINPVLGVTDLVLYLHRGKFLIGAPDEVMRSEVLSELYDAPIEVIRRGDQIAVLGIEAVVGHPHDHAHDHIPVPVAGPKG